MRRADSFEKTLSRESLRARGEGYNRGWDGWMASPTQCTWVWVSSGGWWWTGRPDVLQSMGSQSRTQLSDWTEVNWTWLPSGAHPSLSSQLGYHLLRESKSGLAVPSLFFCAIVFLPLQHRMLLLIAPLLSTDRKLPKGIMVSVLFSVIFPLIYHTSRHNIGIC